MPTKKNVTARKPSARKRARQAIKTRARNFSDRTETRTIVKKTRVTIVAKDPEKVKEALATASSTLDKTARKKVIHRNKAARLKSRLNAAAKKATVK